MFIFNNKIVVVALIILSNSTAMALEKGDWIGRIGITNINTNTTTGTIDIIGPPFNPLPTTGITTGNRAGLTGTIGYMLSKKLELELTLGTPFKHTLRPNAGLSTTFAGLGVSSLSNIGDTKQLPPVLSLNYHFLNNRIFSPYFGIGVNYTRFSSERVSGGLSDLGYNKLNINSSWGVSAQAGIDMKISKDWFINATIRHTDVSTEADILGGSFGRLQIKNIDVNPTSYSLMIGKVF